MKFSLKRKERKYRILRFWKNWCESNILPKNVHRFIYCQVLYLSILTIFEFSANVKNKKLEFKKAESLRNLIFCFLKWLLNVLQVQSFSEMLNYMQSANFARLKIMYDAAAVISELKFMNTELFLRSEVCCHVVRRGK